MAYVQKHLPSYLKRVALSKHPPSPAIILGQPKTDVIPVDYDIPTHSKENEGVKDEAQDRREEHLRVGERRGLVQIQTHTRSLSLTT